MLTSFDARTGARRYGPERLPGIRNVYASPVAAGGRLYVTSRDGMSVVLRTGPTFEVLAVNALDDGFDASPAIVDGENLPPRSAVSLLHRRIASGSDPHASTIAGRLPSAGPGL